MISTEVITELNDFSFDWDSHVYRNAAGVQRPSCTQILHSAGLYDFSKVSADVLERKRRIGESVHRACAEFDREGWLDETWLEEDEMPYYQAWLAFRKDFHEIEWKDIEVPMLRTICGMEVGGTPDRIGWLKGVLLVADLKCAAAVHPAWRIQTATYELMETGSTRAAIIRMAIQLKPNGKYAMHPHTDPSDAGAAIACLQREHASQQIEIWKHNAGLRTEILCN
jgi:hypothetical protein